MTQTTMLTRGLALAIAPLLLTSPAMARDKKPVDPNKRVCRSEIPTGSRMSKSVCHTGAEWAQIDAANAASAQSAYDQRLAGSSER